MPAIPAFGRQRQEKQRKFEGGLDYTVRSRPTRGCIVRRCLRTRQRKLFSSHWTLASQVLFL